MMLPLEQQVSNKELSKKLKELGLPQESLWFYIRYGDERGWRTKIANEMEIVILLNHYEVIIEYSAYTCAELGEMLPRCSTIKDIDCSPSMRWECTVILNNKTYYEQADTEADARAKMLKYLKEKGLIK